MQIGGIQKSSLIDYPGKVSSVIFCSGCNFDCPYCHNPGLVAGQSACADQLDMNAVTGFLDQRRNFLDGVVVSGGEPTLQPDLVDLCRSFSYIDIENKDDFYEAAKCTLVSDHDSLDIFNVIRKGIFHLGIYIESKN